jgi:hypothetical protein
MNGRVRAWAARALYSSDVSDLPFIPARPDLSERLVAVLDADGKIPRALVTVGSLDAADVVVLGEAPARAASLRAAGARVTVLPLPSEPGPASDEVVAGALGALPACSADGLVALWSSFAGPSPAALAAADRVLRPGGRLLVLQDYGRDDLDGVHGVGRVAELVSWSRRDGWYLAAGFRIHVVHAFWQAADVSEARELLAAAFGSAGEAAARAVHRPRVAHNVAIYHRTRPAP